MYIVYRITNRFKSAKFCIFFLSPIDKKRIKKREKDQYKSWHIVIHRTQSKKKSILFLLIVLLRYFFNIKVKIFLLNSTPSNLFLAVLLISFNINHIRFIVSLKHINIYYIFYSILYSIENIIYVYIIFSILYSIENIIYVYIIFSILYNIENII